MNRQRQHRHHKRQAIQTREVRIDFSFKREVFIIAAALVGGLVMTIPMTFFNIGSRSGYYLTWVVFGHIVGVRSPITATITAGFLIHLITATCIGIIAGLFLYKTNTLNISKPSNGLRYGFLVGTIVYLIFAIPVEQFVLNPEFRHTSSSPNLVVNNSHNNKENQGQYQSANSNSNIAFSNIHLNSIIYSIFMNLLFGVTLGLFSSLLSMKFGARYRCPQGCDMSFSRIDTLQNHLDLIHSGSNVLLHNKNRILVLGGGFGGTSVLRKLQDRFQTDVTVDIAMVSKDNYLLFTPMLHEIASGMIETRHIVTPIRAFCNRSRFYCANVENIDLENKQVLIRSSSATPVDESKRNLEINTKSLPYDYLVIALGSETKFLGMSDLQRNAFTIKSLNDAINLRNHIIYLLEQSDQLLPPSIIHDKELQNILLTVVVVGGGFAGVETAGEINDFIHDSAKEYYHNIDCKNIRVVIVQSGNRLLPEMSEELAEFALQRLRNSGVEVILNRRVIGATDGSIKLDDDTTILTNTIIWSGGIAPSLLTSNLTCEHDDKSRKIIVNKYLEVSKYRGVYALGDCALVMDPNTGNPYPPTAQHALREGSTLAKNIIASIEGKLDEREVFDYKTKGMMASIGKRTGVGNLLGIQVQGFLAWWIWRNYYLANLPTLQKKIRVLVDWAIDIFFKRDVTMLKTFAEEKNIRKSVV
ncbi:MAG: NAD(P)/FAD-dependent oxidoreductase [Candidatus Nitrosopolaris sp.]